MSSILASISKFILSILSQPRLVPVRVPASPHVVKRRPLSKLFSFVLPFVFALALFSAAPSQAQAAPNGVQDGMFDCLGSYDWGCRIVSFMFEDKEVAYYRNNAPVVDQPGQIEKGFRVMMGFFSNAMLIIAGVLLMYHLVVMVAETAHTGTIGGKETNQLWAPIRLVIAIGLLVPLSSGMNSGQYIVLQMAKWGSGLASQTWKVFAEQLATNTKLSGPIETRVYNLSANTFKSQVCMYLVNKYSTALLLSKETVSIKAENLTDRQRELFGNKVYSDVCGQILFHVPDGTYDPSLEAKIAIELTKINEDQFKIARGELDTLAQKVAANVSDPTKTLGLRAEFDAIVQRYQDNLKNALSNNSASANNALENITAYVKNAAQTQGWTSAGAWFLAVSRAQGQIITGGLNVPEATAPSEAQLSHYTDAAKDYAVFINWLDSSPDGGFTPTTNPSLNADPAKAPVKNDHTSWEKLKYLVNGEGAIDLLLGVLDYTAQTVGLWSADPKKALGDLGYSTNPFGEISALGYKNVRLALQYMGIAASVAGIGGYYSNWNGKSMLVSNAISWVVAVCMFFATLFMLAGVLLGFVVPLMPFIRFAFSIMTWIGTLLEAMICMPFFALGHLTPKGEGFSGPNARQGYYLLFQIFLRPVLCIFGLIAAMMLFYVMAKFMNAMFYEAVSGIGIFSGAAMQFMQKFVFSILYAATIYICANISFKMMEHIPKHAMRWMGGQAGEEGYEGHSEFSGIAAAVGGQQLLGYVQNASGAARQVGTNIGAYQANKSIGNAFEPERQSAKRFVHDSNGNPQRQTDASSPDGFAHDAATGDFIYQTESINLPFTAGHERVQRLQALREMHSNDAQTVAIKDQGKGEAFLSNPANRTYINTQRAAQGLPLLP